MLNFSVGLTLVSCIVFVCIVYVLCILMMVRIVGLQSEVHLYHLRTLMLHMVCVTMVMSLLIHEPTFTFLFSLLYCLASPLSCRSLQF